MTLPAPTARQVSAFRKEIRALLISLKPAICDEYRAHPEGTIPGISITIGAEITEDGISWHYQTGDNSYTGGAYGFQHWGICDLHRRDNSSNLANDIVLQFLDLWAQSRAAVG